MIKNSLKYTNYYYNLSEKIKAGLKFLEENDLTQMANGHYEIIGDDVFANIQTYTTKPEKECKWEAHRKYIDIQYIIEGCEKIGVGEIENFETQIPYSKEKDVEFLKATETNLQLVMNKNDFVILYPQDVHMPQIAVNEPISIKKAVVKVSI